MHILPTFSTFGSLMSEAGLKGSWTKWSAKTCDRAGWLFAASSGSNKKRPIPPAYLVIEATLSLALALRVAELLHVVGPLEFCTREAWLTLYANGCQEMADTYTPCISLFCSLACSPVASALLTKHSFKDRIINNFKMVPAEDWRGDPCNCPRLHAHERGPGYSEGRWSHLVEINCLIVCSLHYYLSRQCILFQGVVNWMKVLS